jgi:hypothetical protein
MNGERTLTQRARKITDCGPDGGCEECDVCRYLNFMEWAQSVGLLDGSVIELPDGSVIERNAELEAYMRTAYPDLRL